MGREEHAEDSIGLREAGLLGSMLPQLVNAPPAVALPSFNA